jgi:hypothetical protein
MSYDHKQQQLDNQYAMDNPRPGDYWSEMFSPYFVVVEVKGSKVRVLSCMGGPTSFNRKHELNARISVDNAHWSFDYSKSMVVDREWIAEAVRYSNIDGFVADVSRTERTERIVSEWRNWVQKDLRRQIVELQSTWEEFTGWKYLKEDVTV